MRAVDAAPAAVPYLSIGACLGFDAPYLVEWLEFHRLVGVERFFLYNNGDRDGQAELLEDYVRAGIVVLHDWPGPAPQTPAYSDCVSRHRRGSRWIAFIDTDEFLFSPSGRPVPEVLRDYEQWPGIGVCRVFFGTSGHRTAPGGLVTESFTRRLDVPGANHNVSVKSAVDPERTASARNPHVFFFQHGFAVDENHRPLGGEGGAEARAPSAIRLRINHYWTRSEEELARKFARLRPDTGEPYPDHRTPDHFRYLDRMFGSEDDVILQFLPELREALRRNASTRW